MGSRRLKPAKPRSFFKFILSDNVKDTGLRIPKKFTKNHGRKLLLNAVVLIVSDDTLWSLDWMTSDDGNLWLKKGWPEFAEHYCLGVGHMLVFNYQGKSVFHVTIFDPSNCEIDYLLPTKFPNSRKLLDSSINHTEDYQLKGKVKTEEDDDACDFQDIKVGVDLEMEREERELKARAEKALESARAFKSDYPFYIVSLKPSYLGSWGLYIPQKFVRKYFNNDEQYINCVLEASDGEDWGPVKCKVCDLNAKLYGKGWKRFRDENRLAIGDACVVELIDELEHVLRITIYRAQ